MKLAHLHAHFAYIPTDVARMMARLLGVGFSFSAHAWDIYARRIPDSRRKFREAAFITTCTNHGRNHILNTYHQAPPDKIVTVRHGVFPAAFQPSRPAEPLILAVGRLEEKKGFCTLLEACRRLAEHEVQFRCVLAGEGRQRARLEELITGYALQDRVVLLGERVLTELMDLYARATLFVLPCIVTPEGDRDGLPNVLIEAMAMSVPVVATPVSAIPEIVSHGENGFLVPPHDAEALADRMEQLLGAPSLRERMGAAGRARVLEAFDISKNIEKLVELFEFHSRGAVCRRP